MRNDPMYIDAFEAVTRGIALLDRAVPDWWTRIKIDKLDLASCKFCVLGQVRPGADHYNDPEEDGSGYMEGRAASVLTQVRGVKLENSYYGKTGKQIEPEYYGFERPSEYGDGRSSQYYSLLTELWGEEVAKRQAKVQSAGH